MKVEIFTHPEFEREFKRLRKRYRSLVDDYLALLEDLKKLPLQGTPLGMGVRKVRMGVDTASSDICLENKGTIYNY